MTWQYRGIVVKALIWWPLLLFGVTQSSAQTPQASPSPSTKASQVSKLERDFFKNILHDQKAIWTAPFHLQPSDARWLAPLAIGTGALIGTDRTTARGVTRFDDQLSASRIISYPGSTYGAAGVAAIFYFAGRGRNDLRARETGLLSWEALVDSELLVAPLKATTERRRPLATQHRGDFFKGGTSFPSGHAIHAWAVATVIANEYSDRRSIQIAAYGLAAAVSMARFTGEKHFLSDVVVGSALGYGIGRYVYRTHHVELKDGPGSDSSTTQSKQWPLIAPHFDPATRTYGIAAVWQF